MLAMLVGCGLRRGELLSLNVNSIQLREERWVIADLIGKGDHIRTVPVPVWVKTAVDAWTEASGITAGRVFRAINKAGKIWGDGMTAKVLWEIVKEAATRAGIEKLAPHDRGAPAPGSAISRAGNWIRFNSCSGTFRSRPLKDTWVANRGFKAPSTTRWELNRRVSADRDRLLAKRGGIGRPWATYVE